MNDNCIKIETEDSTKYLVDTPNGSKVIFLTECDFHDIVPRLWVQAIDKSKTRLEFTDKIIEEAEGEALTILSENKEIPKSDAEWCRNVLETADKIKTALEQNNFEETTFDAEKTSINISPMKCGDGNELEDIEFYLVDDDLIGGEGSIYSLALALTNYDLLVAEKRRDTEKLQEFYEENIYPLRDVPYNKLTDNQKEDRDYFSDFHKDIYGYRPHNDSENECYKAISEKRSKVKNNYEKE